MHFIAFALYLLAATPASPGAATHTPPALGVPEFVQLASLQGLPADSTVRAQFLAGFRGEFATDLLPAEQRSSEGAWAPSASVSNRFRWLEGDPAEDSWSLQVTLGVPSAVVLPSRGSGQARHEAARVVPRKHVAHGRHAGRTGRVGARVRERERNALAGGARGLAPDGGRAHRERRDHAARAAARLERAARLALEALHRQHGDIAAAERFTIAPALRTEAGR